MVCVPTANDVVVNVAVPPFSVPVPFAVPPSRNWTVPVGIPLAPCSATVAVNVSGSVAATCEADTASVVVVAAVVGFVGGADAAATWTDTAFDPDPESEVLPPYEAVML
jgi:hypothetical protein